ncbi:Hypothetical protein, putative [Bodo saltans]|uniref:Prokaryotic-type class I peptide chain release factors domain-containing protein n=1 Tax=Bodo saltans TaxID=75058 RepID=A0A0S4JPR1_BODSA|nr:Hypothetical protein, putative [Bodo saltans]|eukprot:CUG91060.1 Hypothetical protein, putative [Bodo saltans]
MLSLFANKGGLSSHARQVVSLACPLVLSLRGNASSSFADTLPIHALRTRPQSTLLGGVEPSPLSELLVEGRASRRRFSKANTEGRSHFITRVMERIQELKQIRKRRKNGDLSVGEGVDLDRLHPRVKLDLLRRIRIKERALKKAHNPSPLPRFYSALFRKKYFFKEEDLVEYFTKGRGPGGQATNRRMQTAVVHHKPSGVIVRHSKWPSLWLNRRAARELVNLRLERSILGRKSELGQEETKFKRRLKQKRRTAKTLLKRGSRAMVMEVRIQNFRSILRCEVPFPPPLCRKVTSLLIGLNPKDQQQPHSTNANTNVINGLGCLLNEQCHMWWPVTKALSTNDLNGSFTIFLHCLFPMVPSASQFDCLGVSMQSACDERDAFLQLLACRTDRNVLANIRLTLGCWTEMCGLHRSEDSVVDANGFPHVKIEWRRDENTWRVFHLRWIDSDTDEMQPWMQTALPHMFVSLLQVGCKPEAAAVKRFFAKEVKRLDASKVSDDVTTSSERSPNTPKSVGTWARTGLALLNQATRELVVPHTLHPQ